ncbi:hypothetical protein FACS189431_7940 [Alphaproteobacteria bacterium]|nr:hypothetical protein FACS189431_7940 [Alphaproteobacteria bacterium]
MNANCDPIILPPNAGGYELFYIVTIVLIVVAATVFFLLRKPNTAKGKMFMVGLLLLSSLGLGLNIASAPDNANTVLAEMKKCNEQAVQTMQKFAKNPPQCDFDLHYTTETLRDVRDDKIYRVRCMPDDRWWMIDDLDLVLSNGLVLTENDTNLRAERWEYNVNDNDWYEVPSFGAWTVPFGTELTEQQIINKYAPDDGTDFSLSTSMGHLYSHSLSQDGDIRESEYVEDQYSQEVWGNVCPAGWTVENNGFYHLMIRGWGMNTNWLEDPAQGTAALTSQDTFNFQLAGIYWNGAGHLGQNTVGYLWDGVPVVAVGTTQGIISSKSYGPIAASIRCVLPSPQIKD